MEFIGKVIWPFLKSFGGYMSCVIWTIAAYWTTTHSPDKSGQIELFWLCSGLSLVLGFCFTIREQYSKRKDAENKLASALAKYEDDSPAIVLSLLEPSSWEEEPDEHIFFFNLQHVGGRAATHVQIEPLISKWGTLRIKFERESVVSGGRNHYVGYQVQLAKNPDYGISNSSKNFLRIFFEGSEDTDEIWIYHLDGTISFMDRDEPRKTFFRLDVRTGPTLQVKSSYASMPPG